MAEKKMVNHPNYKGIERRNNNMKVKDFITPTTIITILIGAMALGSYKFIIAATADTVKTHTEQIASLDNKTNIIDKEVSKLETEIPNIKTSMVDIKGDISEIKQDIKKLLSRTQ